MSVFSRQRGTLLSVADGRAIPLSEVPDEAFSSGMLGTGFAVEPIKGTIYSPVDGMVEGVTDSRHAYSIRSDDGLDVLVHIGVDTVKLGGEGFLPLVDEGDRVSAGDAIARADLAAIRAAGCRTVTPVLVANGDGLENVKFKLGNVTGGKSTVMLYKKGAEPKPKGHN